MKKNRVWKKKEFDIGAKWNNDFRYGGEFYKEVLSELKSMQAES